MPDYKSMYCKLFNRITDAITILQKAQQECEDIYIESMDNILVAPEAGFSERTSSEECDRQ